VDVKAEGDTVGGVLEVIAMNVPPRWASRCSTSWMPNIAKALISIPAVKGVEFGTGFGLGEFQGLGGQRHPVPGRRRDPVQDQPLRRD